jgi:hypothetical protein
MNWRNRGIALERVEDVFWRDRVESIGKGFDAICGVWRKNRWR